VSNNTFLRIRSGIFCWISLVVSTPRRILTKKLSDPIFTHSFDMFQSIPLITFCGCINISYSLLCSASKPPLRSSPPLSLLSICVEDSKFYLRCYSTRAPLSYHNFVDLYSRSPRFDSKPRYRLSSFTVVRECSVAPQLYSQG
jgi:hypothetical protein